MGFSGPGGYNTDGVSLCSLLWVDRVLRRLAITGMVVEALRKVHATVGVLLLPDVGVRQEGESLMYLKTASWRTSAARIGEADQLPDDVGGPIHFPGKVNAFFIWVYPKPPVALSCVIYIAYF